MKIFTKQILTCAAMMAGLVAQAGVAPVAGKSYYLVNQGTTPGKYSSFETVTCIQNSSKEISWGCKTLAPVDGDYNLITLVDAGGGYFNLKNCEGYYVCSNENTVNANVEPWFMTVTTDPSLDEASWMFIEQEDGYYKFSSRSGKVAGTDGNGEVAFDRDEEWEFLEISAGGEAINFSDVNAATIVTLSGSTTIENLQFIERINHTYSIYSADQEKYLLADGSSYTADDQEANAIWVVVASGDQVTLTNAGTGATLGTFSLTFIGYGDEIILSYPFSTPEVGKSYYLMNMGGSKYSASIGHVSKFGWDGEHFWSCTSATLDDDSSTNVITVGESNGYYTLCTDEGLYVSQNDGSSGESLSTWWAILQSDASKDVALFDFESASDGTYCLYNMGGLASGNDENYMGCDGSHLVAFDICDAWGFIEVSTQNVADVDVPDGIETISAAAPSAQGAAEYYNLQGMRVTHPAQGHVYIVRQGNTVSKRVL